MFKEIARRIKVLCTSRLYSFRLISTFAYESLDFKVKKKVLIATSVGWLHSNFLVDFAFALFLRNKGWDVEFLLCRGSMRMCQAMESHRIPLYFQTNKFFKKILCFSCSYVILNFLKKNNFTVFEIQFSEIDINIDLGSKLKKELTKEALSGYFRNKGKQAPTDDVIYPKYFETSISMYSFAERIISERSPDWIICHHSIYVPQGPIKIAAQQRKTRLLNWDFSERKNTIYATQNESIHEFFRSTVTIERLDQVCEKNILMAEKILKKKTNSIDGIIKRYNIPQPSTNGKKFDIVFYTNVSWDAGAHGQHRLFPDQMSWLTKSLRVLGANPNIDIAIRIHPGEVRGGIRSSDRTYDQLKELLSFYPNLSIFRPAENVDSYRLLKPSGVAIVYASKVGFELVGLGYRVISVGNSWASKKNILIEPATVEDYLSYLSESILNKIIPDAESSRRALALFWIVHKEYSYELNFLNDNFWGSIYDIRDDCDYFDILNCTGLERIYDLLTDLNEEVHDDNLA